MDLIFKPPPPLNKASVCSPHQSKHEIQGKRSQSQLEQDRDLQKSASFIVSQSSAFSIFISESTRTPCSWMSEQTGAPRLPWRSSDRQPPLQRCSHAAGSHSPPGSPSAVLLRALSCLSRLFVHVKLCHRMQADTIPRSTERKSPESGRNT